MGYDNNYIRLVQEIMDNGISKSSRTGVNTRSMFGMSLRHNMADGLPLLTTKKMAIKGVITELLWFIKGDTNIRYLLDNGCNIWNGDAFANYQKRVLKMNVWNYHKPIDDMDEFIKKIKTDYQFANVWGDLGAIYGKQWRMWRSGEKTVDQLKGVIEGIKADPHGRRHLVSAWNPAQLSDMALPPCHYSFQFYVSEIDGENRLSLLFNMRSTDVGLGLPFNMASYGILLHMVAKEVGMTAYELIFNGGDVHIYENHIEGLQAQINNYSLGKVYDLPTLKLADDKDIFSYELSDVQVLNYQSADKIYLPLSN